MALSRRTLLRTALVGTVVTAGCAGGGGSDSPTATETDEPTETAMSTPTETAMATETDMGTPTGTETGTEASSTATVGVSSHPDLGDVLVDADGLTLYMFDRDTQGAGESACYDGCASSWPPLTVDGDAAAGDGVTASLSTFERENGDMQVAANGWPLYYFASDEEPGDVNGQGVADVWWVLRPDGTPVRPDSTPTASATETSMY